MTQKGVSKMKKECSRCKNGCSGINDSPCSCKCHLLSPTRRKGKVEYSVLQLRQLELIDKIIAQLNGKLKAGKPKDKGKVCGWYSEEYARGFNAFREITLYNLKIERDLVKYNCKSGYELDRKLADTKENNG